MRYCPCIVNPLSVERNVWDLVCSSPVRTYLPKCLGMLGILFHRERTVRKGGHPWRNIKRECQMCDGGCRNPQSAHLIGRIGEGDARPPNPAPSPDPSQLCIEPSVASHSGRATVPRSIPPPGSSIPPFTVPSKFPLTSTRSLAPPAPPTHPIGLPRGSLSF